MYERTGESDYLVECLLYAQIPNLLDKWDGHSPFVRAIAKVRRFNLVECYVIVDGFGNCAKDFGKGELDKVLEVYPYEYYGFVSSKDSSTITIEKKSINSATKAKMYLQQRGYWSTDFNGKKLQELVEIINNLEGKI